MCTRCSSMICVSCHEADERGLALCPLCRGDEPEGVESANDERPVPFEDPEGDETLSARLGETLKLIILTPAVFYERLRGSQSFATPLIFAYLCIVFGVGLARFWQMSLELPAFQFYMENMAEATQTAPTPMELSPELMRALFLLGVPCEAFIYLMITPLALHLGARLAGAEASLLKSFQVYAWSTGTLLFNLVPVVGGPIAVAMQIFAQFAGLRVVHQLTRGRAALACALPVLLAMFGLAPGG